MSKKLDPNLFTLADYPPGEWVYFTGDDGNPSEDFHELALARFNGLVESAVGPEGIMGPLYHRLTDKGRAVVDAARIRGRNR